MRKQEQKTKEDNTGQQSRKEHARTPVVPEAVGTRSLYLSPLLSQVRNHTSPKAFVSAGITYPPKLLFRIPSSFSDKKS